MTTSNPNVLTPFMERFSCRLQGNTFALVLHAQGNTISGDRVRAVAIEEVGFVCGLRSHMQTDLPGLKKDAPIAELHMHGGKTAVGILTEFAIVMDLDQHSPQDGAFQRMTYAATKLAEALNCHISLLNGTPATAAVVAGQRAAIEQIHRVRREAARNIVRQPDGTVKEWFLVPFITEHLSARGAYLGDSSFDMETPETWGRGRAKGLLMAKQLVDAIARTNGSALHIYKGVFIEAIARGIAAQKSPGRRSTLGNHSPQSIGHVADGLVNGLVGLLCRASTSGFASWIDAEVRIASQYVEEDEAAEVKKRADFVERMRLAKAAKKAARDAKGRAAASRRPAGGPGRKQAKMQAMPA